MASGTINNVPVKTGSATYSDTHFKTPVSNFYEKFGNIVHVHFHAEIKAEIPNNQTVIYGLPVPSNSGWRFTPFIVDDQYANNATMPKGCIFNSWNDADGRINQFALSSGYAGKYIIYDFTYVSKQ